MAPVTSATEFEPVPFWAKLPMGVTFKGDATSVATDSDDNVYVFNRGSHPVAVFDSSGNFLEGWGQGEFDRPHGIAVDDDDNLYFVDDGGHFVQKRTREGQVIFTLGDRGNPAPWQGGGMFNRPTGVCINPDNGDFFVSDGYGNSRVHKFDADGNHIKSWGEPGTGPGQFSLPHNIAMSGTDRVVVCDRENFRVQVFTTDGEFVDQWHVHHPMSVCEGKGDDPSLYVGEMGPPPVQDGVPRARTQGFGLEPGRRNGQSVRQGDARPVAGAVRRSPRHSNRYPGQPVRRRGLLDGAFFEAGSAGPWRSGEFAQVAAR